MPQTKLGSGSIAAGAVTEAALASGAVTSGKLGAGAVGETALADDAVTSAKLADEAVTENAIADGAVVAAKIADGTITGDKIGADEITGTNIADGSVGTDHLDFTPATEYLPNATTKVDSNVNVSSPGSIAGASSGDYILLRAQSTASQNGLWQYTDGSTALTRPAGWSNLKIGDKVYVSGNNSFYDYTGTDEWTRVDDGLIQTTEDGVFDGSGNTITLANVPVTTFNKVSLAVGGLVFNEGASDDFTVSGSTVTLNAGHGNPANNTPYVVTYSYNPFA